MKKTAATLIITVLLLPMLHAQILHLLPVKINGKYGYINTDGKLIVDPVYDMAGDITMYHYAVVEKSGMFGIIDSNGKEIIPCLHDSMKVVSANIFGVEKDHQWALWDYTGRKITDFIYDGLREWKNGLIIFRDDSLAGLLDTRGNVIVPAYYDHFDLEKNQILVYKDGYAGLYSEKGKRILEALYDEILPEYPDLSITSRNGMKGFVSLKSGYVAPAVWNDIEIIRYENLRADQQYAIVARMDDREGLYLNIAESPVLDVKYTNIRYLGNNVFAYDSSGLSGAVDAQGSIITHPQYQSIELAGGCHLLISDSRGYGLMKLNGKIAITPKYLSLRHLLSMPGRSYFEYNKDGLSGVVRNDSVEITKPVYTGVQGDYGQFLAVQQQGKLGVLGLDGRMKGDFKYDRMEQIEDSLVLVYIGKNIGVLNYRGEELLNPEYEKLSEANYTIKAYKGSSLEIVWLSKDLRVLDKTIYEDIPSVHINDPNARYYMGNPAGSTDSSGDYSFFYHPGTKQWGLKNVGRNIVRLQPQFDNYLLDVSGRFAYVFKKTDTVYLSIDQCEFYTNQLVGLVDLQWGRIVLPCDYIDINVKELSGYQWFARTVSKNGKYGIATNYGAFDGYYSFVSKASNNVVHANVDGDLYLSREETENSVISLKGMTGSYKCKLRGLDRYTRKMMVTEDVWVDCVDGSWVTINQSGNPNQSESFNWMGNEYRGYSIVDRNRQRSLWSLGVFISIHGMNYDKWMGNDRTNIYYQISKPCSKYGLLDQEGKLRVLLQWDYMRNLSEGMAAVKQGDFWGFIDSSGAVVIPCIYEDAGDFHEGLARVKMRSRWGYINAANDTVIKGIYSRAGDFKNGIALVKKSGVLSFIRSNGEICFDESFVKCGEFEGGYAVAQSKNGTGIIDEEGKWVIRDRYDKITYFSVSGGYAIVSLKGDYGIIGFDGKKRVPLIYSFIRPPSEGLLAVRIMNHWGFIDERGKVRIPAEYSAAENFSEGRAVVKKGNSIGVIDSSNHRIVDRDYTKISNYHDGYAIGRSLKNNFTILNHEGKAVRQISNVISVSNYEEGLAVVRSSYNMAYFIDTAGNAVFNRFFDNARMTEGSELMVRRSGDWGLMDRSGKMISELMFDSIRPYNEGKAVVCVTSLLGIGDNSGRIKASPEYHQMEKAPWQTIRVRVNDDIGYISSDGREIWKPQH
jgi:uncharacterized protein YegP (UPF0339 family)